MPEIEQWDIREDADEFTLIWRGEEHPVAPAKTPLGLVIDAACEFMDFMRRGDYPQWVEFPSQLMEWCVRRSWRQA